MTFLINGHIVFQPERQTLKNTQTGAVIELGLVTSELLAFLLRHADIVSNRNDILEKVFSQNNVSATDGNLNQHIMMLRKSFTELQCAEDVIVTVPKVGFKIGSVHLTRTEPEREDTPQPMTQDAPPEPTAISKNGFLLSTAALSALFFAGGALYYFLAPAPPAYPKVSIFKTERYQQCEVAYTSGTRYSPPEAVISKLRQQGKNVDCHSPMKIILWRNSTSTQQWDFTTLCDSLNRCRGDYVYTQK
jgi:DNA-binding winged helix-turn-helix (wHTH) protein